MEIDNEWLRRKIISDPNVECEAGTMHLEAPQSVLSAESLIYAMNAMLRDLKPDPLFGLVRLHCAQNMVDDANKIADAAKTELHPRPLVIQSALVPPGYIIGINGKGETVLIGGPPATQGKEE